VQRGDLKVLGVVGDRRISSMPGVPTIVEQGVRGLELTGWLGVFAPAGTPATTVSRLNSELTAILHRPEIVERFRDGGSDVASTTPSAFAELIRNDYQRWGEVVRRLGIKAK